MDNLLKVLREQAFDKKPTVDELKKIAGLENITAKERDEAWKVIQDEKQAQASTEAGTGDQGDDQSKVIESAQAKDDAAGEAAKSDAEKNQTTATTTTTDSETDSKPDPGQDGLSRYRVTVKRDGFRRLGRAWTGSSEVALSDNDVAVLQADTMFNVVAL